MKQRIDLFDQINSNKRKSIALAFFVGIILFSIILVLSLLFREFSYLIIAFGTIFVLVYIYAGYKQGHKVVLRATKAIPADERKHLHLHNVVEGLSIAAGIPKPDVYVIESDDINAFATGPDPENSSVAITTGALQKLNRGEIEAVMAHEISHIRNYDIRFSMLVAVLVGLVAILSNMMLRTFLYSRSDRDRGGAQVVLIVVAFVLALLAPIVTKLVQLAISRRREYLADAGSAQLTRHPDSLVSALEKIAKHNSGRIEASGAVSHIFFTDPKKSAFSNLLATHPPVEKRIEILKRM